MDQVLCDEAFISLNISDMRGINEYVELKWGGEAVLFEPGIKRGNEIFASGISVGIPLDPSKIGGTNYELHLDLKGSEALSFLPLGKTTKVKLGSSWTNPSFTGLFCRLNTELIVKVSPLIGKCLI